MAKSLKEKRRNEETKLFYLLFSFDLLAKKNRRKKIFPAALKNKINYSLTSASI